MRRCRHCDRMFPARRRDTLFCSRKCKDSSYHVPIAHMCKRCGNPCQPRRLFCSADCLTETRNGRRRGDQKYLAKQRAVYWARRDEIIARRRITDFEREERLARQSKNVLRLKRLFKESANGRQALTQQGLPGGARDGRPFPGPRPSGGESQRNV